MRTMKRLKEGLFNSSVEVSKPHGKEKKKEKTGERKDYAGYKKKGSKGDELVVKEGKEYGGSMNTSQDPRIGIHFAPAQMSFAIKGISNKQLQSNRCKYI